MKWLFIVLALCNGGLYLWVSSHLAYDAINVTGEESDASAEGMELVHERQARRIDEEITECMRIGPFSTADTFSRASLSLINERFGFTRKVIRARVLRNFRVYLGPFTTQAAKETAEQRLIQQNIDYDTYQDKKEGELLTVAGLFSAGEAAGAFVAELKDVGIHAKARSEVRTLGPLRWLEVSDVVTEDRRNTLRGMNWGDVRVQIIDFPCSQGVE
jgi:hypothetical protein